MVKRKRTNDVKKTNKLQKNEIDDTVTSKQEEEEEKVEDVEEEEEEKDASTKNIKIYSFNVASIRSAIKKGLNEWIQASKADIICFSEVKASKSQVVGSKTGKNAPLYVKGYNVVWNECTDKKGMHGTAILSKEKPISVTKGIGVLDGEGRAIACEYEKFIVVNTYVPNSGSRGLKRLDLRVNEWDPAMYKFLLDLKKPFIWTGDLNVAILDYDVHNPKKQKGAGFTPAERKNFREFLDDNNLVDVYRHFNPKEKNCFTFWSYMRKARSKNQGWRLDYFIVQKEFMKYVKATDRDPEVELSDHIPISLELEI